MGRPVLDDLTFDQHAAVTHPGGPLVVLAGAGAGKTRVLCRRLAWLIEGGARPVEVLALTFTRQAAQELSQRAEDLLGRSHETLRVMTYHAWAEELVRVHGVDHGLAAPSRPVTDDIRKLVMLDRLAELDLRLHRTRGDLVSLVDGLIRRIDRCRDELVSARDFLGWAEAAVAGARDPRQERERRRDVEFARAFAAHDEWLAEDGLEDFGMPIARALDLMRRHPDRLAAARAGARHVLVDEFQDTNHAQGQLLLAVAMAGAPEAVGDPTGSSLVVVGDDDQGIYRFRGASAKNVVDFRRRFPDAAEVRLERNYRSTQAILDVSHALVAPIPERVPKRLAALADASGPAPRFWRAPDPDGQARAIAAEILLRADAGTPFEEQAVLMRAVRTESGPITRALEQAGIPHQVRGGLGLLERREVRSAIAWLRAALDPADAHAHLRVACDPALGIPWNAAAHAVAAARGGPVSGPLLAAAAEAGAPATMADALAVMGHAAIEQTPADALRVVLDVSGLRTGAIAAGGAEGAARLAALSSLERLVRDLCADRPELDAAGVAALLTGLAQVGFRGDSGASVERRGVQVMTIHQSKGLEFDAVYVVGMTHRSWPGRDSRDPDIPDELLPEALPRGSEAHIAEARRLGYVAMTRARRHLVVCTVATSEAGIPQRTSQFFEEALAVSGGAVEEVGEAPERDMLDRIGQARERLETASLAAARARALGASDADTLAAEAREVLDLLVAARAEALVPTTAPVVVVGPPVRSPRPGVTVSISDIAQYRRCPLQYRYARIDRVPPKPSPQREIGMAAHTAFEGFYAPDAPAPDVTRLVKRFEQELRSRKVDVTAQGKHALEAAEARFPDLVERTRRSGVQPVAVERGFTMTIGPHKARGRIDRVDRTDSGYALIDYKTGPPPPPSATGEGDLVMRLYLAGAREAWKIEPRAATLEYVFDGEFRRQNPDGMEIAEAMESARQTLDDISAERFEPRPSWGCRQCDFNLLCPAQDR